jgi:hypothetical protein
VHFFLAFTELLLMQIIKLEQRCIRRIGKENFVSAGCDTMISRQPAPARMQLYPADTKGGLRAASRTQPGKQRAPKNSLFPLLCIIFSRGKYFGCFIYE